MASLAFIPDGAPAPDGAAASAAPAAPAPHAANWEEMWSANGGLPPGTLFDISGSHALLADFAAAGRVPVGRCLVPGCGRGYDVALLAALPGRFAVGLELSATAAATAEAYVRATGAAPASFALESGDFFTYAPAARFDFIYDYTFLCALPPHMRSAWAAQMAALLAPGALLLCMQFPLVSPPGRAADDWTTGPPFLLSTAIYDELLGAAFELVEAAPVEPAKSNPRRAGAERFALFRRRA